MNEIDIDRNIFFKTKPIYKPLGQIFDIFLI